MPEEENLFSEIIEEHNRSPVAPRRIAQTTDLDITPMIDVTFLLLIFFLVASTTDVASSVDLPPARYGTGVSDRNAVIITVAESGSKGASLVYLGDGTQGTPLPKDPSVQQEQITQYVQEGSDLGKSIVLVKAAKGVRHRDVSSVASAVGRVQGTKLHLAVLETE